MGTISGDPGSWWESLDPRPDGPHADDSTGTDAPEVPQTLVLRARRLQMVVPGVLGFGFLVAAVVIGTHSADVGEGWQLFAAGAAAFGAVFLVMGYRAPRRGIDADENGLQVTNMFSHRDLRWEQLRDIHFEPVQNEIGVTYYYRLVLDTDSGRVVVQAPGGTRRPGGRLDTARSTLLAMRDEFTKTSVEATDHATSEEPSAPADAPPESATSQEAGPRLPLPEGFEPPSVLRIRHDDIKGSVVWRLVASLLLLGAYAWLAGSDEGQGGDGYDLLEGLHKVDVRYYSGTDSYSAALQYLVDNPGNAAEYLLIAAITVFVALMVARLWLGAARVMRLGIDADAKGMVVTNMYRRHAISWSEVEDITDETADGDPPVWHRLQVVAGERVVPSQLPVDQGEPDGPVGVARLTLLAMRDVFAAGDTSDEPAARPWLTRRYVLIPAGVVALALVGFAMFRTGDRPALSAAIGPPPSPTAPTAAADASPSSTQTTTPTPTTSAKTTVRGLHATGRDGTFEFTVTAIECGMAEAGDVFDLVVAKGEFCAVSLSVVNVGDLPKRMEPGFQDAFDAKGHRIPSDFMASLGDGSWLLPVYPRHSLVGRVYFDVPKGMELTRLELHDSLDSRGAVIRLI
jgi:Domain of unknown function (DUF4352)